MSKQTTKRVRAGAFKKGYDPRRNTRVVGKKGRSGRKPDAWKELMRRLVNRQSTIRALKRVIKNPRHPAWQGALKFAAEQAYGKPSQEIASASRLTLEHILAGSHKHQLDEAEPAEVLSITDSPKALGRGSDPRN